MSHNEFKKLFETIKKLRDPDEGCPWDLKQSVESLAPSLLEECCECLDGVSSRDYKNVQEELGDVIFTATLMSYILEQDGLSSTEDIIKHVNDKMIRRHPHVFGNRKNVDSSEEVLELWDEIKVKVEGRKIDSILGKIPRSLPPLEKSYEIQKKVKKVGFDWDNISHVFDKIAEETREVKEEIESGNHDRLEQEIGDLLFSVVNLSRFLNISPDNALRRTNEKFINRFNYIENKMKELNLELSDKNFKTMDTLWDEAKKSVK